MNDNIGGNLVSVLKKNFTSFKIQKRDEQDGLTVFAVDIPQNKDLSGGNIIITRDGTDNNKDNLFNDFKDKLNKGCNSPSCDYMYVRSSRDNRSLNIYLIEQTDLQSTFNDQMNTIMTKNIPIRDIFDSFKDVEEEEKYSQKIRSSLRTFLDREWRKLGPQILISDLVRENLSKYICSVAMTFWYQLKSDYRNIFPPYQNYYFVLLDIPNSNTKPKHKRGEQEARRKFKRVLKEDIDLYKEDIYQKLDSSIKRDITGSVAPFQIKIGGAVIGYKELQKHIQIY